MLHDNCCFCLVESSKQRIKDVGSKIPPENSETKVTLKRVWIRPKYSASAAFLCCEDKDERNQISVAYDCEQINDSMSYR